MSVLLLTSGVLVMVGNNKETMKQLEINGHFVDLTMEEMVNFEGGRNLVVDAAYLFGRIIGEIAKIQSYSGDNGQWMA